VNLIKKIYIYIYSIRNATFTDICVGMSAAVVYIQLSVDDINIF